MQDPPAPRFSHALRLGLLLCLASCRGGGDTLPPFEDGGPPAAVASRTPSEHLAAGYRLYAAHCESCHGARGAADGELAPHLFPPPRDFADGTFKLVSSQNGAPFDRDLVRMLQRGMPGSAMPAFGWLAEEDLWSLAAAVRDLSEEGLAQRLTTDFRADGLVPLEEAEARARVAARARLTPDVPIEVPLRTAPTPASRARGAELYAQGCASCHGDEGRGRPRAPRPDANGTLNWARDLTAGILKGGDRYEDLVHRIRGGMPGTSMGATALAGRDLAALAEYVSDLIPPGAHDALRQTRGTLPIARVPQLPASPDDAAWERAVGLTVVLAPLTWTDRAVPAVRLSGLHDGTQVQLRVAWHDRSPDDERAPDTPPDACALQLSSAVAPPLSGMGSPLEPTTILHWRAAWPEGEAFPVDGVRPHGSTAQRDARGVLDAPLYLRVLGRGADAQELEGSGAGRVDEPLDAAPPTADARWSDGSWRVVFERPLDAEAPLAPGATAQIAVAVWNGSAGDAGPRKALSIWQKLELEP